MAGADTRLKDAILNELFEDLAKLTATIEVIHQKQEDWTNNLDGIANDVINEIADKVSDIVLLDVKNAGKTLAETDNKLKNTMDTLQKMGVSISALTKRLEKQNSDHTKNYVIIGISVFVVTNLFNFALFYILTKL